MLSIMNEDLLCFYTIKHGSKPTLEGGSEHTWLGRVGSPSHDTWEAVRGKYYYC